MPKPDYNLRDPKGWCGDPKRGAALGRRTVHGEPNYAGKMVLVRVRVDNGGYDKNGTYFGDGGRFSVYWFASADEDQSIEGTLWAASREEAKRHVREMYPNARFYR